LILPSGSGRPDAGRLESKASAFDRQAKADEQSLKKQCQDGIQVRSKGAHHRIKPGRPGRAPCSVAQAQVAGKRL